MLFKFLFIYLRLVPFFLVPFFAKAQTDIPFQFIGVQAFNFFIFLFLLLYFIKTPLQNFLKQNQKDFLKKFQTASSEVDQNLKVCQKWEKDIQALEDKQQHQNKRIHQALQIQKQALEKKFSQKQQSLIAEVQREWERQKYQHLQLIKKQILNKVLSQSTKHLKKAGLTTPHLLSARSIIHRS